MNENQVSGRLTTWNLNEKLGEGDAGEVYLVSSARTGSTGILKRPRASAFQADILRQASQIESEGRILQALKGFRVKLSHGNLTVPQLLDQARYEAESSGDYFIVIEKAPGIDLDMFARISRGDPFDFERIAPFHTEKEVLLLANLYSQAKFPDAVLAKCLEAVIVLFEEIHRYPVDLDGMEKGGILWNDVKPEHVFWDPESRQCTVIDWGNAQFLEQDGTTRDRRYTANDDERQFIDSIGKFTKMYSPGLVELFGWQEEEKIDPDSASRFLRDLYNRIEEYVAQQELEATNLREKEAQLLQSANRHTSVIKELVKAHQELFRLGEYPDFEGAGKLAGEMAARLLEQGDLAGFQHLADWANNLPLADRRQWQLLAALSQIAMNYPQHDQMIFLSAIRSGMQEQTEDLLWDLLEKTTATTVPPWFRALSKLIRTVQLDLEPQMPTPLESVFHFTELLEQSLRPGMGLPGELQSLFLEPSQFIGMNEKNRKMTAWVNRLNRDILPRWQQLEPDPPQASLAYNDINSLVQEISAIFPAAAQVLFRAIYQPQAQVQIILDAWERKDFDLAERGLRRLLVWDPERLRILQAAGLIRQVQDWLQRLSRGPQSGETVEAFATRHEVYARELRNRVGPAEWLNALLLALKGMRMGSPLSGIVQSSPGVLAELPWLRSYLEMPPVSMNAPGRRDADPPTPGDFALERKSKNNLKEQYFVGCKESQYGLDGDLVLGEPLDLWTPAAQGSSARVFQGFLRTKEGSLVQRAVKIMRPSQREYALPLFEEEVRVLRILNEFPGITPLFEFGFLLPQNGETGIEMDGAADILGGEMLRYGWDCTDEYLEQIESRTMEGWLPYLIMEKKNDESNLLTFCDAGYTQGDLAPVKLGLLISSQICRIMAHAHQQCILYRDHKILHYYWQPVYNGVFVIDWNVAKLYNRPLTQSEQQFDLVQFGARALHHILTGRPAPGALPLGPTRPDEIEKASNHYNVSWSFDDQRLSDRVKQIVEATLSGAYHQAETLQHDLEEAFHQTHPGEAGEN